MDKKRKPYRLTSHLTPKRILKCFLSSSSAVEAANKLGISLNCLYQKIKVLKQAGLKVPRKGRKATVQQDFVQKVDKSFISLSQMIASYR